IVATTEKGDTFTVAPSRRVDTGVARAGDNPRDTVIWEAEQEKPKPTREELEVEGGFLHVRATYGENYLLQFEGGRWFYPNDSVPTTPATLGLDYWLKCEV